jgi:hypothetical protein
MRDVINGCYSEKQQKSPPGSGSAMTIIAKIEDIVQLLVMMLVVVDT